MSVSRENWSTLSRLAKQWIEDDEEEQKREKRRRHRDLSSTANRITEVLPEHDNPCTNLVTNLNNEEEKQENQTSKQLDEETQKEYENENEFELEKVHCDKTLGLASNAEKSQNHGSSFDDVQEQEKPKQNNLNSDLSQRGNELWNNLKEKCQATEVSGGKQQIFDNVRVSNQKPSRQKELVKKQDVQHEEINIQRDNNIQRHNAAQNWKNSASFSLSTVDRPSDPETKKSSSAASPTSGNNSFKSQVFVSSVKIQRHQSKSGITSPSSIPEETIEEVSPATRAIRTKVIIPSVSNTIQSHKEDMASPQTSSSFKRFTPFTSSIKIVRTESESQISSGLRRSSSLRLSLRKIDDRVEKYTSAVKKSASVKIPTSHNQGVLGVSNGIVSKRSIFEKEESTARSNISKKDIQTGDVASKRILWQQRSQASSDTKL